MNVRRWLRKDPQPVAVKCDSEGPVISVVRESRSCWGDVEDAITVAGARVVSALSKDGKVLRTLRLSDEDEDEDDGKGPEQPQSDLVVMSQLLLEAGDRGALRATEGLTAAVNALVQVLQIAIDRVGHAERQLEETREALMAANGADELAKNPLAQVALAKLLEEKKPTKPNGKSETKGEA